MYAGHPLHGLTSGSSPVSLDGTTETSYSKFVLHLGMEKTQPGMKGPVAYGIRPKNALLLAVLGGEHCSTVLATGSFGSTPIDEGKACTWLRPGRPVFDSQRPKL